MVRPNWPIFAVIALLVTAGLLVLSRASARALREDDARATVPESEADVHRSMLPTGTALLANVVLTHGLLGAALFGLVWWAGIPTDALGMGPIARNDVVAGLGLGVGLYLASEAATVLAGRLGFDPDERLRALLAPEGADEWAILLLLVLPLISLTEELLFRGILVGAFAVGFDLAPPVLVVVSSVLFGLGHSAQGGLGVLVTATLGLVLGAAFVATGSLTVVVVAHYSVDVLEFVVREVVLD